MHYVIWYIFGMVIHPRGITLRPAGIYDGAMYYASPYTSSKCPCPHITFISAIEPSYVRTYTYNMTLAQTSVQCQCAAYE